MKIPVRIALVIFVYLFGTTTINSQNVKHLNYFDNSPGYDIAVYYFPNYHPDSINARWHGKGWTEWEVLKAVLR
jgi:uracil-DNA glycosylase